jgi:hypothetical protein
MTVRDRCFDLADDHRVIARVVLRDALAFDVGKGVIE